jgi:hypothetical protein
MVLQMGVSHVGTDLDLEMQVKDSLHTFANAVLVQTESADLMDVHVAAEHLIRALDARC